VTYQPHNDPTDLFKEMVKKWVQHHDTARREMARQFSVALSTVDRWWIGTASPHPLLKQQVMKWIEARLGTTNAR
jgi:hypothetical protein